MRCVSWKTLLQPIDARFVRPQAQASNLIGRIDRVVAYQQLLPGNGDVRRQIEDRRAGREVQQHQLAVVVQRAREGVDLRVVVEDQIVDAVDDDWVVLTQLDQPAVVVKD